MSGRQRFWLWAWAVLTCLLLVAVCLLSSLVFVMATRPIRLGVL